MENPDLQAAALERVRLHARDLFPLAIQLRPQKPDNVPTQQGRCALLAFKLAEAFEYWDQRFEFAKPQGEAAPSSNGQAPAGAPSGGSPW